ncbi:hypothetical protein TYRP_023680 [Tyrophagus putrescentiae]|nr:hypothetical protein TYRP_023680 [Tyrophagus putrescentiae]
MTVNGHHPGGALKATDFHNDILITYHGHSRDKLRAYFYDFSQILCPSNKLFDAHLDKYCAAVGLVGHRSTGIPVNYLMKDLPPPLFFIDRNVEGFQFSPLPLKHIVTREKDIFEVYETASQKLIGKLGAELSPEEHWIKIAALNYCETLELFIVLADIPSYAKTGSVLMYDAVDGQLMLQFHTPLIV